jgi:hypothetical protein
MGKAARGEREEGKGREGRGFPPSVLIPGELQTSRERLFEKTLTGTN